MWLSTGPGLLTRSVAHYLAKDLPGRLKTTTIFERYELLRVASIHCIVGYKFTKRHWSWTAYTSQAVMPSIA